MSKTGLKARLTLLLQVLYRMFRPSQFLKKKKRVKMVTLYNSKTQPCRFTASYSLKN